MSQSKVTFSNVIPDDPVFAEIIKNTEIAIENGILPERIYQGSSGSYFVKSTSGVSQDILYYWQGLS